jgi:hypothetical protein
MEEAMRSISILVLLLSATSVFASEGESLGSALIMKDSPSAHAEGLITPPGVKMENVTDPPQTTALVVPIRGYLIKQPEFNPNSSVDHYCSYHMDNSTTNAFAWSSGVDLFQFQNETKTDSKGISAFKILWSMSVVLWVMSMASGLIISLLFAFRLASVLLEAIIADLRRTEKARKP